MEQKSKIFVAGHTGLVGSAIIDRLRREGYSNLVVCPHAELDLTNQSMTEEFFIREKPEYVFVAAGLVGGIKANSESPADFYTVNMAIANNVIISAHKAGVRKLLYLGSACMYPKECPQPMKEDYLLTGIPEVTNEGYALAKICGSRLCTYMRKQYGDDFISAIPANAYGEGEVFDSEKSHVIPALIMKYQLAKETGAETVVLWGSGKAKREFIHTDDIASACIFLMNHYSEDLPINVGTGEEITILELSEMIRDIVGFQGKIVCDLSKPDGMMRRIVDSSRVNKLGWCSSISLESGLRQLYLKYINEKKNSGGLL